MARMAPVFGAVIAVMLGLHIWSAASAKREITKRIQPLVDAMVGVTLSKAIKSGQDQNSDGSTLESTCDTGGEGTFPQLPMAWKS